MVITLNSEPFDVTIENEKTLDELISGLSNWLSESGYVITDVFQNDTELTLVDGNWGDTPLDTIEKIDIKAISESDKYISDLQTLYQYITLLHNSVTTSNKLLTEDLLSELPFIKSSIDFFFGKNSKPAYETQQLEKLISNLHGDNDNQALILLLQNITVILKNRIKEVTSPFTALLEAAEKLEQLIPEISDVSVMLQTGEDKKAIDSVLKFIELSENLIRIFPFIRDFGYTDITKESINKESFNDFFKEFNGILKELVTAFDINDSILIGDLMEYEIVPKVIKLMEYINLIEKIEE
jgi:hypothetical protein